MMGWLSKSLMGCPTERPLGGSSWRHTWFFFFYKHLGACRRRTPMCLGPIRGCPGVAQIRGLVAASPMPPSRDPDAAPVGVRRRRAPRKTNFWAAVLDAGDAAHQGRGRRSRQGAPHTFFFHQGAPERADGPRARVQERASQWRRLSRGLFRSPPSADPIGGPRRHPPQKQKDPALGRSRSSTR